MRKWGFLFLGCLFLTSGICAKPIPRTLIALYSSLEDEDIFYTKMHSYAQFPLNHLGIRLEYHDVVQGLPEIQGRDDVLGIITWFRDEQSVKDRLALFQWMNEAVDSGKKVILMGAFCFDAYDLGIALSKVNRFLNKLGLEDTGSWIGDTYQTKAVYLDPKLTGFERKYRSFELGFREMNLVDSKTRAVVLVKQEEESSKGHPLVSIGPNGAYVAQGYALFEQFVGEEAYTRWYLNPFLFFEEVLELKGRPIPDITTLSGRRIYYSHIDGDGWRSLCIASKYKDEGISCAETIYREIVKPYPAMPLTIGPVVCELDPNWLGTDESRSVAKKMFLEPHIEMGCHTFSHPFDWAFFKNYRPRFEWPYLTSRERLRWGSLDQYKKKGNKNVPTPILHAGYTVPRGFAEEPFNIQKEVEGALSQLNALAPEGKRTEIYLWSGNCEPFERILSACQRANVYNINGGDSRLDQKHDSYAYVKPFSRQVGSYRQIYSSNSNENTYTDMWKGQFWRFRELIETFKNTESPRRVLPMNLYYHIYSGEREESLKALIGNLEYCRGEKICPIWASEFSAIVEGFYSAEWEEKSEGLWKISNRGALQTVRFDKASEKEVNFSKSKGAIGQKYLQGSLYVYLDASEKEVVIALRDRSKDDDLYLIESRWRIEQVKKNKDNFSFQAKGFGAGEMNWHVPFDGFYLVRGLQEKALVYEKKIKVTDQNLKFEIPVDAIQGVFVEVKQVDKEAS